MLNNKTMNEKYQLDEKVVEDWLGEARRKVALNPKYGTNRDMNDDTYKLRRKVMNYIYEARDLVGRDKFQRIAIRIVDLSPKEVLNRTLGMAHTGKKEIFIPATSVTELDDSSLRFVVLHEIAHALFGIGHFKGDYLMDTTLKYPVDNAKVTKSFLKHAKNFKEYKVPGTPLEFKDTSRGSHNGQVDATLEIYLQNEKIGFVDYSIYNNEVYIQMIEVDSEYRGKGYGKQAIQVLADEYGYENISWGEMTGSGFNLQKSLDKLYNFNRQQKHKNRLPSDILFKTNSSLVAEILTIFSSNNYEKGWEFLFSKYDIEEVEKELSLDLNMLSELASWLVNSKSDDHRDSDSPPNYIVKLYNKLKK